MMNFLLEQRRQRGAFEARRNLRRQIAVMERLQERKDPFLKYSDAKFKSRYRFSKGNVLRLTDLLEPNLQRPTNRSNPLLPVQQILVTLRYFATGSVQKLVGDDMNISPASICRTAHSVARSIASFRQQVIQFPRPDEMHQVQQDFYNIAQFPGVVGAIDCTHVPIISPGGPQAVTFINRKSVSSINVQVIGDARLRIRNVVARWPGSAHDTRIFTNSSIAQRFERGDINGILLGDSGYPVRRYLMTPLRNPVTREQIHYNSAHKTTRNIVERLFGVLKRRFPIIGKRLDTALRHTIVIIVAVCVLHNISQQYGEVVEDDDESEDDDDDDDDDSSEDDSSDDDNDDDDDDDSSEDDSSDDDDDDVDDDAGDIEPPADIPDDRHGNDIRLGIIRNHFGRLQV
ncbi:putative nuclease HARBI1 [Amphiura filiformis]|uniref:putative nuclease HARBI1 n=1 Tax=Amphiura filiformis TaxID=82378 RepID=UPI003B212278